MNPAHLIYDEQDLGVTLTAIVCQRQVGLESSITDLQS